MRFDSIQQPARNILKLEPKTTLFIVSCTVEKIWDEKIGVASHVKAREAYKGDRFIKFLKWYQINNFKKLGYSWVILSGKYGFIEPDHPIGWYDINMDNPEQYPISTKTLKNQAQQLRRWDNEKVFHELRLREFKTIICINCSITYLKKLKKCFRNKNYLIIEDLI